MHAVTHDTPGLLYISGQWPFFFSIFHIQELYIESQIRAQFESKL